MTTNLNEDENVQSLSEKLSTFADQNADQNEKNSQSLKLIMEQLQLVVSVNQQLSTRIATIESNVIDSQAPRTPPDAPVKQQRKSLSKKNLQKLNVEVENDPYNVNKKDLAYDSDDSSKSGMSYVSNISNEEDLKIISSFLKPGFQNTEQSKKEKKV